MFKFKYKQSHEIDGEMTLHKMNEYDHTMLSLTLSFSRSCTHIAIERGSQHERGIIQYTINGMCPGFGLVHQKMAVTYTARAEKAMKKTPLHTHTHLSEKFPEINKWLRTDVYNE